MVPRAGVEPARPFSGKRRILSPQCLPISPSGRRLPNAHLRCSVTRAARARNALSYSVAGSLKCSQPSPPRKKGSLGFPFEYGAGNGTGTRALSHCFPTTFSAAVIGEGLKYSLIFPPWRSTARPRCRQAFMTSPVAVRPTPGFTLARAPPPSAFTNSAIPITQGNGHCPPRVCNRARDLKPLHVLERRVRRQAPTL